MPAANVQEVFEKHLPERLKSRSEVAAKINSSYKFVITGEGGGTWVVDLTQTTGAIQAGEGDAKCTITMAAGDFVDLMNGKLNPQMAFMSGKLKVAGDMGLALKLGSLLS